jgi:hypothetical protein
MEIFLIIVVLVANYPAKVRISERKAKEKAIFLSFPNESTFGCKPKVRISERKAKEKCPFILSFPKIIVNLPCKNL